MFIRAKIDPMFDNDRPQVDALLGKILQQTKTNAEKQVSNAEFAVLRMKSWFDGDHVSNDDVYKYDSIQNKISCAKNKFEMQSYFGYDDALRIMSEANELVDEIQANIWRIKNSSETELNRCTDELDHVSNNIKFLKQYIKEDFSKRIFWAYGLLFFIILSNGLFYWILFYLICILSQNYLFDVMLTFSKSERDDYNGSLIANIVVSLILFVILSVISIIFGNIIIYIYSLIWPLLPNRYYNSKISKVEYRQKKTKESINDLEKKIAIAKESLII